MNKFFEIIKITNIHIARIKLAQKHISRLFPINPEILKKISESDLAWIELLVSRFGKLQDLIGTKLIDLFFEETGENIENLTMLDKINKLEKLGIIENSEIWQKMRITRNHVAHEYPENPELTQKYLNTLYEQIPQLIKIAEEIENRYKTIFGITK